MRNIFILVLFAFLVSNISAVVTSNATTEKNAEVCLNDSKIIMNEMANTGFNILRINDTIKQANTIYNSQIILKERRASTDFSPVVSYCADIVKIRDSAIDAADRLTALIKLYNDTITSEMDTTELDATINEIQKEITDERYENVPDLVDKAYEQISKVKSSHTAANVIYRNTSKSIKIFIEKNWRWLTPLLIILIVLYLIYKIRIAKWLINNKIEKLKIRKKTIKELVMQTQKDYFQSGKMPEGEYNIKTKKFTELIRDIDRQVPLLQEELARLESKKNLKRL